MPKKGMFLEKACKYCAEFARMSVTRASYNACVELYLCEKCFQVSLLPPCFCCLVLHTPVPITFNLHAHISGPALAAAQFDSLPATTQPFSPVKFLTFLCQDSSHSRQIWLYIEVCVFSPRTCDTCLSSWSVKNWQVTCMTLIEVLEMNGRVDPN